MRYLIRLASCLASGFLSPVSCRIYNFFFKLFLSLLTGKQNIFEGESIVMNQLVHKELLRTLIITCMTNTNSAAIVKISEQFHHSLEYYLQGSFALCELN